jgi:hypothetical protein
MRIALLDVKVGTKIKHNFTAVNMRNMLLLKNSLNADFYYSTEQFNNKFLYDIVIFGFNSISTETKLTQEFIRKNTNEKTNFFVLCGEYEQSDCVNLRYEKRDFSVIQNYEGKTKLGLKEQHLNVYELNLNLLIAKEPNQLKEKKYDCIYYGRWREDRKDYFKKYIQDGLYLSTSTKNMKKFKHVGCNPKYLDTINWTDKKETLNLFRYSLYIEDKFTHNVFNNLANRWYEAGFCNNVMFFDKNCLNTIRKSEIGIYENEIKNYIVTDKFDLQEKINECNLDFEKHLEIQKSWRINELKLKEQMIQDFKKIIGILWHTIE